MIQPKDLYRKLAALLAKIDAGRTKDDFLFSVLAKLENAFAKDLHIANGRLYREDRDQFLLMNAPDRKASANPEDPAALDAVEFCLNAVRALLNFRLVADAMTNDVQQAAIIQQSLLPSNPPHLAGYETAGRSEPAEVVGGDFFDFSVFGEEVFSVAVGDASGHGLPAALLVRDVVTGLRMGVEKEMKMGEAMQKLNRVIYRSTLSAHFVSLFYGEIESNGTIFYVNAGHLPPLLVHGVQVKQLKATGTILGALPEISLLTAAAPPGLGCCWI